MVRVNTLSSRSPGDRTGGILLLLKERGTASISELAVHFAVSAMTVRRVLHKLADSGLVIRTPGGAMLAPSTSLEKSFLERSAKMARAKNAIGREAAKLVREGDTVVLDSGTTTRYVARYLASRHNVTVVTTSLAVLEELAGSPSVQVRLTGGVYRRSSHDLTGNSVVDVLGGIYADKVFFGAAALSFHRGVMNFDAEMPSVFLRAARERILVIDSSKIGEEAAYRLCAVEKCDKVVTDKGIKPADLTRLRKLSNVLVAD
ncbi:MAG TPA: DeoR/GlpR family DNA-binding transcription regulator [Candidatus Sulfotelmatobacter sp.]|nr:DeoR/GlpR family DNA-binding transcription regulator [Candidatus Sulfotelmatobacter sp.]